LVASDQLQGFCAQVSRVHIDGIHLPDEVAEVPPSESVRMYGEQLPVYPFVYKLNRSPTLAPESASKGRRSMLSALDHQDKLHATGVKGLLDGHIQPGWDHIAFEQQTEP